MPRTFRSACSSFCAWHEAPDDWQMPSRSTTLHVWEAHHRHKADHPSGTALQMAELLLEELDRKTRWSQAPARPGRSTKHALYVASHRAGETPGTHVLALEGPHDRIEVRHEARGRRGFARGAVEAAEWIWGRSGVFAIEDMLRERFA